MKGPLCQAKAAAVPAIGCQGRNRPWDDLPTASALVAAVPHREYAEMGLATLATRLVPGGLFADVKCAHDPRAVLAAGLRLWRL